jgi:hypothetical protein
VNFSGFNDVCAFRLSVVGDISVDSKAPMVTLSILRICRPIFVDASRGRVYTRVFMGMSVRAL